jgi:hypothetical protein
MERPECCASFWAALVLPAIPCRVTIPDKTECALTNAALDQADSNPPSGRLVLYLAVNGGSPVAVLPFTIGVFESSTIDLRFGPGDRLEFTISGTAVAVHVCGYLNGGIALEVDNGAPPAAAQPDPAPE